MNFFQSYLIALFKIIFAKIVEFLNKGRADLIDFFKGSISFTRSGYGILLIAYWTILGNHARHINCTNWRYQI